ncbi:hypothetical protein SAMN04488030_2102 [Aliiroseovarius halocynthiae]|nr:hypothetical protein SAMN04488030_2102 [Aliiroseovarius halocynthiae]
MFVLTFSIVSLVLGVLSIAFVAAFWWDWASKISPYLSLSISLLCTSALMASLSLISLLYSAGAFCPELLTTTNKCEAIENWGWSMWLLGLWIPVMLYALWKRFQMHIAKESFE